MSCSSAPTVTFLTCHHLPRAQHEGLVPAVTRTVKTHQTNPLQWGQLYKWSLSKTEQSFSDLKRCKALFPDPGSSFPYSSVRQEPIYWSQQLYLSGPAEVTWEQHEPSCTGLPEHLSLQLKVCSEMLQCLQLGLWPDHCTSVQQDQVLQTAVKMHFTVCQNAVLYLFPSLCNFEWLSNAAKTLQTTIIIKTKNQVIATFNLKANFRNFFLIFIMARLLFSIFIKSSIVQTSLGHARKKEAFREKGYGWILPFCPCFLQLLFLYSLLRKASLADI